MGACDEERDVLVGNRATALWRVIVEEGCQFGAVLSWGGREVWLDGRIHKEVGSLGEKRLLDGMRDVKDTGAVFHALEGDIDKVSREGLHRDWIWDPEVLKGLERSDV